jgi:hypothetical protein
MLIRNYGTEKYNRYGKGETNELVNKTNKMIISEE